MCDMKSHDIVKEANSFAYAKKTISLGYPAQIQRGFAPLSVHFDTFNCFLCSELNQVAGKI